jgi:hypothetical protein
MVVLVREWRAGMSREVGWGRSGLLLGMVEEEGRVRMVNAVRWDIGRILKVLVGGAADFVAEVGVGVGVEEVGGMERTIRFVTGSAV